MQSHMHDNRQGHQVYGTSVIPMSLVNEIEIDAWLAALSAAGRKDNTIGTHRSNVRQCLRTLAEAGMDTSVGSIGTDQILFLWENMDVCESTRWTYEMQNE